VRIRLAQDEWQERLVYLQRSSAATVTTGLDIRAWTLLCSSSSRSASAFVRPAGKAGSTGNAPTDGRHGSDHVFEIADRVGDLPELLLRHARLEIERRHRGIDLP